MSESLPNHDRHPDSPDLTGLGVALRLGGHSFRPDMPAVLHVTYCADGHMQRAMHNLMEAETMLIVCRCDRSGVWSRRLVDSHNMVLETYEDAPPVDPSFRVTGFFNVDLLSHFTSLEPGGRYWVMAAFGDYVSDRLPFSIVEPS
ncbi:MAG: hypothetical protein KC731_20080 [Myxococcales bacterium]|nr:hypothetical protein [Myxococcales bacterium]